MPLSLRGRRLRHLADLAAGVVGISIDRAMVGEAFDPHEASFEVLRDVPTDGVEGWDRERRRPLAHPCHAASGLTGRSRQERRNNKACPVHLDETGQWSSGRSDLRLAVAGVAGCLLGGEALLGLGRVVVTLAPDVVDAGIGIALDGG